MNRLLVVVALATLVCAGCAADTSSSSTSPSKLPTAGVAARLELNAVVPTGANGGVANVTARVLDAFGAAVVGTRVDFSASSGTFSDDAATTSDKGIASTILTADPGTVTITAKVASMQSQTTVSVQPRLQTPTPTPSVPAPPLPGPPTPTPPLTVTLLVTPSVAGTPTKFALAGSAMVKAAWTFGDGGFTETTVPTAAYIYANPGVFAASVTVTDAAGRTASDSKTVTITTTPPPPTPTLTATLAASPSTVTAFAATTLTVTATPANGAAAATLYTIDCGDGTLAVTSASKTRSCTYTTPGNKSASATATNGAQTSALATTTVSVTAAPTPTIVVDCSTGTSTTTGPAAVSACNVSATLGTTAVDPATITVTSWTWGDGQTGTTGLGQISQSHQYTLPSGTTGYAVIVTATVPNGGAAGTGTGHAIVH